MYMEKLKDMIHLFVTVFLSSFGGLIMAPAITDVTMSALCPGQDECSLAIYLSGFQQAVIGLGTVVMMPVIGNLSDRYGRKTMLTIPLVLSIIPQVILAYSRTTNFFYAYYVLRTITGMICDGSINCIAFAYLADTVSEKQRTTAFGILAGITETAIVSGTLAARFLSPELIFQVAAFVSALAAVYMKIFLKDSQPKEEDLTQPILKSRQDVVQDDKDVPSLEPVSKRIPSVWALICLLNISSSFLQAAVVAFFDSLADNGMQSSIMYYLKARFEFSKNQYAEFMLLISVAGMASQLVLMPLLAPRVSEEKLLSIGLFAGITDALLHSLAWADWVPYVTTICALFESFVPPCIHSIVSKQVGPNEQGMAQGRISGIISLACIIAPLIFSPLTALFLSEGAPFHFPGFSILCIGFSTLIAFLQSLMIRAVPPIEQSSSNGLEA